MAIVMTTPGVFVREAADSFLSVASGASAVPVFLYLAATAAAAGADAGEEVGEEDDIREEEEQPKGKTKSSKAKAAAKAAPTEEREQTVLEVAPSQIDRIPNWVTFTRVFAPETGDFVFDPGNLLHLSVKTYLDNGGGLFYTCSVADANGWDQEILAREDITLVVQAGVTTAGIGAQITAVCVEGETRFALLDGPKAALTVALAGELPSSRNAAAFYPWLEASWADGNLVPPSAAVAGAICETDQLHGPWHAAANFDLRGGVTPSVFVSDDDQSQYMDVKAVNMIRAFPGRSSVIWGVRTLQADSAEGRYIPVRRLMLNAQKDIRRALRPLIFEPNYDLTWARAKNAITSYLHEVWRLGGLMGATGGQAFYVKVGLKDTMTNDDVLQGKMIIQVGLAITRPAEFIVLRFTQIMNSPSASS